MITAEAIRDRLAGLNFATVPTTELVSLSTSLAALRPQTDPAGREAVDRYVGRINGILKGRAKQGRKQLRAV